MLAATVSDARGPRVLLIDGFAAPGVADVAGRRRDFHSSGWARKGPWLLIGAPTAPPPPRCAIRPRARAALLRRHAESKQAMGVAGRPRGEPAVRDGAARERGRRRSYEAPHGSVAPRIRVQRRRIEAETAPPPPRTAVSGHAPIRPARACGLAREAERDWKFAARREGGHMVRGWRSMRSPPPAALTARTSRGSRRPRPDW